MFLSYILHPTLETLVVKIQIVEIVVQTRTMRCTPKLTVTQKVIPTLPLAQHGSRVTGHFICTVQIKQTFMCVPFICKKNS